jgi:hypothetical protein
MGTVTRLDDIRRARQAASRTGIPSGAEYDARARRYRLRAEELRAISEEVMLRETCLTLLSLAQSYDQMAATMANMACQNGLPKSMT